MHFYPSPEEGYYIYIYMHIQIGVKNYEESIWDIFVYFSEELE